MQSFDSVGRRWGQTSSVLGCSQEMAVLLFCTLCLELQAIQFLYSTLRGLHICSIPDALEDSIICVFPIL